uniref:RPAP1_C domain-containing protein n=2 Tax=Mesocestoides corti TaxID=53468 RepID=A0A5K3ENT8_MESCO
MKEREAIIASTDPKVISFLMHKRSPNIGGMSEHRSDAPEHDKSDTNVHSVLSSLGIDEDSTFPHMDVVEPEKLAWMQDLPKTAKSAPDVKSADPSEKPCNARFDLEGRVVPPNADIPTHLGLHHHGEEPERGGYTIDEIFHLASSTQPSQRRIALSCLASALAASRRGRHGGALQTSSLVSPLLSAPAAVCFLLRWSLDKAVSEVTRVGAPGGSGGVSLAVVCECLRALDNLLSDGKGEILLDETFEWTPEVRAVGNCRPSLMKKPHKFHPQPYSDSEMIGEKEKDTSDHVSLMAVDPVACLFETTNLASRFAWMLSSGLGIQFPPDVVAHWLPSILLKGVRHSLPLASKIFNTPNLVGSLIETFLPMTWDNAGPLAQDNDQLSVAYGIPLPGVLKLMRVFAQRSLSQRITLVNKWNLVERCFAYLLPKASSGVLDHLPSALPTRFRVMLQVESLRCLSVCLEGVDPPTKAVEITRSTLHKLVEAGTRVHKLTLDKTSFEGLEALWLAWLSFFAKAVLPRFSEALSNAHVDQVNVWANDALEQAVSVFVSKENTNSLPISLTEIPGTLPSLTTTAFELMCLLGNQGLVTRREQIFNGSTWNAIFSHFIRYQSVLTGFPGRPSHVDVVNPMYFPSDNAEPPSLPWTRPDVELDDALLTPITVSAATPCLPDLGMATCLLYRGEEGAAATLPCLWWPPSTPTYPVAVVEPVDLATSLEAKSPSFLPLIEAAVRCCDFAKLMPWCQRLVRLKIPPIMAKGATALPHGLLAIETELMGRALLNAFSTGKQTSNDDLWWTSLCLLPCLFFGQEARLLDIIRRLVFPPDALTPVERDFPAEFASTSAPWPPVHENFPTALAHHAHCVYTAYFVDLLQRSADAPLPKYQALEFRPACDFILPDDWFYMPLLECYFLRNCRLAGKACGDDHVSAGALDPEV